MDSLPIQYLRCKQRLAACQRVNVGTYDVECLGQDAQGREKYRVNFKFDYVKPGTNFIRIYESGQQGTTHTYPFKNPKQSVSGAKDWWDLWWDPVCFTIDVYDVLPTGKVVKCSIYYCVWVNCSGGGETNSVRVKDNIPSEGSAIAGETSPNVAAYVAVAPNPAMDVAEVLIDVPSYDPSSSLDIIDLNGNVVATLATGMPQGQMIVPAQLDALANGTYMVRMLHSSGVMVTRLQVVR